MKLRTRAAGVLAVGVMVATWGYAITPTSAATPVPVTSGTHGASFIPWSSVGPGWLLATWNQNTSVPPGAKQPPGYRANPPQDVYLVSPTGARYLVLRQHNSDDALEAWSGDGHRALMVDLQNAQVSQLDLATGALTDTFRLHTSNSVFMETVSYTKPDGLALLETTQTNDAQLLQRYSLTGTLLGTYPRVFSHVGKFNGSFLESPSGTELALAASDGVAVVDNDGTVVSQLHVPGTNYCTLQRWWAPNVALAACNRSGSPQRLYEINVVSGAVAALTVAPRPPDAGDENAWSLRRSVFVQDAGGCGFQYLARLQPDHRTTPVNVPRVNRADSVFVLGTHGDELALQATVACGGGTSALWFNPFSNTSTVVLGPPLMGGGVQTSIIYPTPYG